MNIVIELGNSSNHYHVRKNARPTSLLLRWYFLPFHYFTPIATMFFFFIAIIVSPELRRCPCVA
jgi:hypothetical protein